MSSPEGKLDRLLRAYVDGRISKEIFEANADALAREEAEQGTRPPVRAKGRPRMLTRRRAAALVVAVVVVLGGVGAWIATRPESTPGGGPVVISDRLRQPEFHPDLANLTVANDSVTYRYSRNPGTLNYSVGDVIVGRTGLGYLRWVRDVQRNGTTVVVTTEQASLADAIIKGGFRLETSVPATRGPEFIVTLDHTLYDDGTVRVTIHGEVRFSVDVRLDADFSWGLRSLYFAVVTHLVASLGLDVTGSLQLVKDQTLFSQALSPITLWALFVPIVFVPRVDVVAGANLQLQAGVSTSITSTITTTSGVQYDGQSWSPVSDVTKQATFSPSTAMGSLDATAYALAPRFDVLVYGITGPYVELKPYVRIHAAPLEDPWWVLNAGLSASAGVRLEIFDHTLADVSLQLFAQEWELARAPPRQNLPSPPTNLTAGPGDATVALSWQPPLTDGGSAVTNYKVYRGTSSGGEAYVATIGKVLTYADAGLMNGVTYYYKVSAVNAVGEGPPSAEASATPSSGGTSMWTTTIADGAPGSPTLRIGHAAVYDAASNRMVVFGGTDGYGNSYNGVWVLTNANGLGGIPTWTNTVTNGAPGSPRARFEHTAVYDAASNRMVVFGGGSYAGLNNDVWVLANANGYGGTPTWTNIIANGAPNSPPARGYHIAVYDAANNRMIVFGGYGTAYYNDAWVLSHANGLGGPSTWTNTVAQGALGSPPSRFRHSAEYDAASNRMVVFGGVASTGIDYNDVWVLSNANGLGGPPTWTNTIANGASGSPSARHRHTAVYDATTNRMIVFGGSGCSRSGCGDVWVLPNANGLGGTPTWTNTIADGALGSPPARAGHSAVYDAVNNRMIVFGGAGFTYYNDVWVLTNANGLP